jgi:hypothetical protein
MRGLKGKHEIPDVASLIRATLAEPGRDLLRLAAVI